MTEPVENTTGGRGDLDKMSQKPSSVQRELEEARRILSQVVVPPAEPDDRNLAGELRAWLMTYSGMIVSRRDAENLIGFLVKSGWEKPI